LLNGNPILASDVEIEVSIPESNPPLVCEDVKKWE
jgi:hypothetical protein